MLVIEINGRKIELTSEQQRRVEAAALRAMRTPLGLEGAHAEISAILSEDGTTDARSESMGAWDDANLDEQQTTVRELEAEIERLTERLATADKIAREWAEQVEGSDPIERDVARTAFRSWLGGDPYRLEFERGEVPVFESLFDVDRACKSFDVALTLAEHGEIGSE